MKLRHHKRRRQAMQAQRTWQHLPAAASQSALWMVTSDGGDWSPARIWLGSGCAAYQNPRAIGKIKRQ